MYLLIYYLGISNKENQWTIKLSIKAIKKNIPCDQNGCEHKRSYVDLPNGKGFESVILLLGIL